jgi:signal peptidase
MERTMPRPISLVRRLILAVWVALIALVLALVAVSHVAPALGYRLLILKGPSMEPSIPLGSLAFERPATPEDLAVGQVVTFVTPNHVVVTHRITRMGDANGTLLIETQGDANAAPDPAMHPATGVTGIVEAHLPLAGFVLAFLAVPTGMLTLISLAGSLLLAAWLLEELEADRAARAGETDGGDELLPVGDVHTLEPAGPLAGAGLGREPAA